MKEKTVFVANYNVETDEEKEEIEKIFADNNNSILLQNLDNKGIDLDGITKIVIIQSSVGVASIVILYSNIFRN